VLAVALLLSAQNAYRESLRIEEYPYACDSFGYLEMAKEIREVASHPALHAFKVESPQTRLLINLMRSQNLPFPSWNNLIAPHAYHYFPHAGQVGVQYPPGTGLILALFPEGKAVYGLNRLVVWAFLTTGMLALLSAGIRQAWMSAGLVVLAIHLGLSMLMRLGSLSFSMNAVFLPILLACLLALLALRLRAEKPRLALFAAFGTGLCLGLATLIRLPSIFLVPGFLLLLWPDTWRKGFKEFPCAVSLAVILSGILPLSVHQYITAGAWYVSTYSPSVQPNLPTLEILKLNLTYYFGHGYQSEDNWSLPFMVVGFCGFVVATHLLRRSNCVNSFGLSWKRLALSALTVWLIPAAFLLSQKLTGLHYLMSSNFGVVALTGFGALAIESSSSNTADYEGLDKRLGALSLAVALALLPGIVTLKRAALAHISVPAPAQALAHQPVSLPAELSDEHAWVWADVLTGTLWYYAHKPAFRIQFTNTQTRVMVYRFVFERGEPQYIIRDSEFIEKLMDEIARLGGTFERRGEVDGQPYFLIHWPETGPASINVFKKTS